MEPATAAASSSSTSSPAGAGAGAGAGAARRTLPEAAELKLRRKTLESVLEQCQRALELMREDDLGIAVPEEAAEAADQEEEEGQDGGGLAAGDGCDEEGAQPPSPSDADYETDELCDLLKLRVESPEFPEKLDNIQKSMYQHGAVDETISWDIISAADIWDDESMNVSDDSEDGYVLVKQEDTVDGIASFMAEYLLPLKQTKDLTPNQLQQGHPCPPRPAAPSSPAFFCPEIFRNFQLQEEYDTYDDEFHFLVQLPYLWTRTKIIEIVAAKDVIFALSHSGLCGAFNRTTNKHICYLNISPDEVIRSLFYNKNNESLITVSVYESDRFSSLKCRTTPIEYIRRGQLDGGFPLFETESLKYPGFVEFDDVNGKVLTFSAQDSTYKVFDLKNYNFLYSICDKNIQEIKISPGIMLVIYQKASNHVPLAILSIEDGTLLKTFTQLLHQNRKVDFIEQFNEKLLVKQDMENLQIIDVRNSDLIEVNKTEFMTPSAFIFLYKNNLFLTFCNRTVAAWNVRGELVTSFDDHELWHPNCNANNIYITADEDLIISYCKVSRGVTDDVDDEGREASPMGSINMSNIFTGKCVAKITPLDPTLTIAPRKRGDSSRSTIRSSVADALEDITALFYDEDRNEIYTGNSKGLVHVWSN